MMLTQLELANCGQHHTAADIPSLGAKTSLPVASRTFAAAFDQVRKGISSTLFGKLHALAFEVSGVLRSQPVCGPKKRGSM